MENKTMIRLFEKLLLIVFITNFNGQAMAQGVDDLQKIAASQDGASPLFFKLNASKIPSIGPGTFYDEKECTVRSGMANFLNKMQQQKQATVAFIGGSITQGNYCYRLQTAKYLQTVFPETQFKWINAGVSGTGTDLGAFRLKEQVLDYQPDLIFIEFAVNKAYAEGMEGMIRQIIKHNPKTTVCMIYTILHGQTQHYQQGNTPENIQRLEKLADYYELPSIHLGMEAAALEKEGALVWKAEKPEEGKILFSKDGIHPLQAGGDLYAAAIARGFEKMKSQTETFSHTLKQPLLSDKWEHAIMIDPSDVATFDKNWKQIQTNSLSYLKKFSNWFDHVAVAEHPGAGLTFSFKGDMFGLFDIGGPEVGQLEFEIDGKKVFLQRQSSSELIYYTVSETTGTQTIDRFNVFCNNRYRGQHDLIELPYGEHTVKITVSEDKADKKKILGPRQSDDITSHPEKYDRTAVYIGKILIRGELVK